MKAKLTDTAIRSYKPRATQYSIGDAACPGLCIRITPKGVKTFAFAYRNKITGKVEWLTIGRYPDVPLTKAREAANDARKAVAAGGIPLAAKARARRGRKTGHDLRQAGRALLRRASSRRCAPGTPRARRCNGSAGCMAGTSGRSPRSPMTRRPSCCRHRDPARQEGERKPDQAYPARHVQMGEAARPQVRDHQPFCRSSRARRDHHAARPLPERG